METHVLLMTALRAIGVYVIVLVVIRLTGKRAIGNFGAFDLLVALMIGEVVDEIIYGDVTFLQGIIPIVVIAVLHEINAWLSCYRSGWSWLLEGRPSVLVKNGQLDRRGMREERMSEENVNAQLRVKDVYDLREVKLARVEIDGTVSVILQEWARPLQKADLGGELTEGDEAAGAGPTEPPDPAELSTAAPADRRPPGRVRK